MIADFRFKSSVPRRKEGMHLNAIEGTLFTNCTKLFEGVFIHPQHMLLNGFGLQLSVPKQGCG